MNYPVPRAQGVLLLIKTRTALAVFYLLPGLAVLCISRLLLYPLFHSPSQNNTHPSRILLPTTPSLSPAPACISLLPLSILSTLLPALPNTSAKICTIRVRDSYQTQHAILLLHTSLIPSIISSITLSVSSFISAFRYFTVNCM